VNNLIIRPATFAEFSHATDWAEAEGWNPGIGDLAAFHPTDPQGFIMGWLGNEPVSSISVVQYGPNFGFLGFYIVKPEYRGSGIGIKTWNAGLAHLEGLTVGLDGVIEQQDNYQKSGFTLADRNIRYTGIPETNLEVPGNVIIRAVNTYALDAIVAFETGCFPVKRSGFVRDWLFPADPQITRRSLYAESDGDVVGYGTIRECQQGYKIGPLFADSEAIAQALFGSLCAFMPRGSKVSLDTPLANKSAVKIAECARLAPAFETARMYRGPIPNMQIKRIFGITSFELG